MINIYEKVKYFYMYIFAMHCGSGLHEWAVQMEVLC